MTTSRASSTPGPRTHEPELVGLRKLADDLARGHTERTTTGHLLAAIASGPSGAADLLHERRLDVEVLLKAARVATDDASDGVTRAIQRAREFANRSPAQGPTAGGAGAAHLLFALCQERASAAHRALEQCGADVAKLRTAAMQLAMGLVPARRHPATRVPLLGVPMSAPPSQAHAAPAMPKPSAPQVVQATPLAAPPSPAKPRRARHGQGSLPGVDPTAPTVRAMPRDDRGVQPGGRPAARFALDPKKYPMLCQLGKNLTVAAASGDLDPVVGRDEEIERTLDVLAKRCANNPCLVGVAGVGKTSIARGIALRIARGEDVATLDDRVLVEIEPAALLAGTGMRGALAERIAQIKAEVRRSEGRVVLFFDEIHTLFSDANDEGTSELKMALAKGELGCIGATTVEEYRRVIEADAALARRFTPVEVCELGPEDAFLALEQVAPVFAKHHGVEYADKAIASSITWSVRYLPGKALPDKALGILDLAGARARRRGEARVCPEQIAEVVSELAGVPTERLLETDGDRMLRLEELLGARIVGHKHALSRIAMVLRRNASGFRSRRPIGSFLLLGPTGVGKTETAKAIAECLFYSSAAMTRLDLSEYAEPHAIARLVGAPPGYVGHEAGGQLTEAVRRRPYQVILLDEIEKAHRDVLEAFLQVFDEGRLTDGRGRTIDFTNTVILLTSNLGAEVAAPRATRARIGFGGRAGQDGEADAQASEKVVAAARAALPPELYNRLDEVLAFAPLTRGDVAEVARRMLVTLGEDLERTRGVRLDVSEAAIEALLDAGGYDADLGARPMRRAIGRLVEAPIAEMVLRGELQRGDVATVDCEGGAVVVDSVTPRPRA
jgi:ATP-dependent Clp protease ATP-binding subunit ClpC